MIAPRKRHDDAGQIETAHQVDPEEQARQPAPKDSAHDSQYHIHKDTGIYLSGLHGFIQCHFAHWLALHLKYHQCPETTMASDSDRS